MTANGLMVGMNGNDSSGRRIMRVPGRIGRNPLREEATVLSEALRNLQASAAKRSSERDRLQGAVEKMPNGLRQRRRTFSAGGLRHSFRAFGIRMKDPIRHGGYGIGIPSGRFDGKNTPFCERVRTAPGFLSLCRNRGIGRSEKRVTDSLPPLCAPNVLVSAFGEGGVSGRGRQASLRCFSASSEW